MSAYGEGYDAGFNNQPYDNPYPEGTRDNEQYLYGYCIGEDMSEAAYGWSATVKHGLPQNTD